MIDTLQKVIQQAEHLPPEQQQALAEQIQRFLNAFNEAEPGHPVFFDEVSWMKHLERCPEELSYGTLAA